MSYSKDLREIVLKQIQKGESKTNVARRFEISRSRIYVWLAGGGIGKPGPKKARKVDETALVQMIKQKPDLMLKELAKNFKVDQSTISYALKRLGISRKKNVSLRRSKAKREEEKKIS